MATTQQQLPPKARKPAPKAKTGASTSPKKVTKVSSAILGNPFGEQAISVILYGPSGVGKTSVLANLPNVGFMIDPQEQGIRTLVNYNQCPTPTFVEEVPDFEETLALIEALTEDNRGIQNLVGDSLTGLEQLCFTYHCREFFDDDWTSKGFYSYQQGPKNAAKTDWPRFLTALNALLASGVNVWLVGHSEIKSFANPVGPDYDQFVPCLDKATWGITHRWAKAVFFYNYYDNVEKKGSKHKADMEAEQRFIYTARTPVFTAKNQFGLTPVIDAGSDGEEACRNLMEAFKKARK
jgi:hypothetical protein